MVLLSRKTQAAFKVETTPGTAIALGPTNVVKAVGQIQLGGVNPLLFEDETINATIGELPQFASGVASWDMPTISIALAGHGDSTSSQLVKLPYGHLIEACGFEALDEDSGVNDVLECTIGAITNGPFRHGETVTAGTGETGVVIGDTWDGTTTIFLEDTGLDIDSTDTITGATSGATATISAIATLRPHAYRLLSDPDAPVTLTGGIYHDGKLIRAQGCRGNMVLRVDHANRAFLDFSFKGVGVVSASSLNIDSALLPGVTIHDRTAPASLGLGLQLNNGSLTLSPTFNRLQLDIGNQVELQEDTNDSDGWDVARITNRSPRLTVNPREVLTATYPFIDNMLNGVTARSRFTIGTTAGNRFTFILPFLSTDSLDGADRQGVREWDGTFRATKGTYTLSGETAFGVNNEIIMLVR